MKSAIKHENMTQLVHVVSELPPSFQIEDGKNIFWIASEFNLPSLLKYLI